MLSKINAAAQQQGWTTTTTLAVMLEFINEVSTEAALLAFMEKHHSIDSQPLGWQKAVEETEQDADLSLFECEVGLFGDDPSTPFDTVFVLVACEYIADAPRKAVAYARKNTPSTVGVTLSCVNTPENMSALDY
jgi:hypothetical protein